MHLIPRGVDAHPPLLQAYQQMAMNQQMMMNQQAYSQQPQQGFQQQGPVPAAGRGVNVGVGGGPSYAASRPGVFVPGQVSRECPRAR